MKTALILVFLVCRWSKCGIWKQGVQCLNFHKLTAIMLSLVWALIPQKEGIEMFSSFFISHFSSFDLTVNKCLLWEGLQFSLILVLTESFAPCDALRPLGGRTKGIISPSSFLYTSLEPAEYFNKNTWQNSCWNCPPTPFPKFFFQVKWFVRNPR